MSRAMEFSQSRYSVDPAFASVLSLRKMVKPKLDKQHAFNKSHVYSFTCKCVRIRVLRACYMYVSERARVRACVQGASVCYCYCVCVLACA